jgi:hypothetical protein
VTGCRETSEEVGSLAEAGRMATKRRDPSLIVPPHFYMENQRPPGHTIPFIGRLTRAYLNFEVKDAPKARRLRRSMILQFKVQIRFSAAVR